MEYTLRRTSRLMEENDAVEILRRCDWGVLSLVGPDAAPYGVPLNHVLLEEDGTRRLAFHCAREGRKVDCLKHGRHGAYVVVDGARVLPEQFSTAYASVMVSGPVDVVDDPAEKRELLRALVRGLAPEYLERGDRHIEHRLDDCFVLVLHVERICGKRRKTEEGYALAHLGF